MPKIPFYTHESSEPLIEILKEALPYSSTILQRIKSPQNESRDPSYIASFNQGSKPAGDEVYTIAFVERARKEESHCWIFNSLTQELSFSVKNTETGVNTLSSENKVALKDHVLDLLHFIKSSERPADIGYPFDSKLQIACLHPAITHTLVEHVPLLLNRLWKFYFIDLFHLPDTLDLPIKYRLGPVRDQDLDLVLSTSVIARQRSTQAQLPNIGIFEGEKIISWAFLAIDGSLATLYVLESHRGQGLAKIAAIKLLTSFREQGNKWSHADVSPTNIASQTVCQAIGGNFAWTSSYTHVDLAKFEIK
jgi:hypothetical protein